MNSRPQSLNNFLKDIFRKADVIGLGETNHGTHQIVFKQLNELDEKTKSLIAGIFIELPINVQESVNYYLSNGIFNENLKSLLRGASKEGKDFKKMFILIFDFARNNNISVICVDSSKTKQGSYNKSDPNNLTWFTKGESRDDDMSSAILDNINKKKGKWLFIAHIGHTGYVESYGILQSAGNKLKEVLGSLYYSTCIVSTKGTDLKLVNQVSCHNLLNKKQEPSLNKFLTTKKLLGFKESKTFTDLADGFILHNLETL